MRDALRVLQQRRREGALKLKTLRAAIKVGIDELERGDFLELDAAELRAHMNRHRYLLAHGITNHVVDWWTRRALK